MPTIRRTLLVLFLTVALAFLAGCGKSRKTLHIYNWADYMEPSLVQRFEEQFHCTVVLDTFDSNESMHAKIKAGATGYDVVFPTSYMARIMHQEGLLRDLDHAQIPNLRHVDAVFLAGKAIDKTMKYSAPYMLGTTGLAYREDKVENFQASWAMFDRTDLKGRMTMLNDMREVIGSALKYLGYSLNTTDEKQLAEALAVCQRWKANLAKFEAEAYKPGIASGEFFLVHGYSGDILQVQEENEQVIYVLPTEGFSLGCDDMVIPQTAAEPELAHAFINFLHEPANAAANTDYVFYLCPNSSAYPLMSEDVRNDPSVFIPAELMEKAEVIQDLGMENQKYIKIWDQIKSGE